MAVSPPALATVGDNCVDRYVNGGRAVRVGGNALNVAVGLGRAGYEVAYLGAVGDDEHGRLIRAEAGAAGVDVSRVKVLAAAVSAVTHVKLDGQGERQFLSEKHGASGLFRPSKEDLAFLSTRAWVHAANLISAVAVLPRLAARGVRLSYDFSDRADPAKLERLCLAVEVAFFSVPDGDERTAADRASDAVSRGSRIAVVTRGKEGSLAATANGVLAQPATAVDAVDTLGAGDAFIAAFIAATLEARSVADALRLAADEAAEACTHVGAWRTAATIEANK